MKAMRTLPLCLLLVVVDLPAIQLPLGVTDVTSCISSGSRIATETKTPRASVQAIVEGDLNPDDRSNADQLQQCALEASGEVGLKLLATQPGESGKLFKKIFLQCVDNRKIPVQIYFVATKVDTSCDSGR